MTNTQKTYTVVETIATEETYVYTGDGFYMETADWYGEGGPAYRLTDLIGGVEFLGKFTSSQIEERF